MRLLHTSDWHVGKTIRGRSRADEHRAVLAEIVGLAVEHSVDLVLVGGDLFDTAAPTAEAESIVYRALLALADTGASVVVIAGNHDNPRRLAAVRPLLELAGVRLVPSPLRPAEGGVIELASRDGEAVRIAVLPFLSQRNVVRADQLMAENEDQHLQSYAARMRRIVERLCAGDDRGAVSLLLAHAMVLGAHPGGGERAAHTALDYAVRATAFPDSLHYVALGHLHRRQRIEGPCPIWYCGSPLQLDFGETDNRPSVNLVTAVAGRPAEVDSLALTAGRRLVRLRGSLQHVESVAASGALDDAYVRVELDEPPRIGLGDEIRERIPNAVDVRLVGRTDAEVDVPPPRRIGRSPLELMTDYLDQHDQRDDAVTALFTELLEEVDTARE